MKVLLVTKSDDAPGIEKIMHHLRGYGATPIRFNTDGFPAEHLMRISFADSLWTVRAKLDGQEHDLSDLHAIYYRRIDYGRGLPAGMNEVYKGICRDEARKHMDGLFTSLNVFQMDRLPAIRRAEVKPLQLKLAAEIGLTIPRSLFTNDAKAVLAFSEDCSSGLIAKMLESFTIIHKNREKVVFTSRLSATDLENLEGLQYSPMLFQELIPKKYDIRVIIVGSKIFASALDSQTMLESQVDWRRKGHELAHNWFPIELPKIWQQGLLQLMRRLDLHYGAIDLIMDPNEGLFFLEINPVGEFHWLDDQRSETITEAIADLLVHQKI